MKFKRRKQVNIAVQLLNFTTLNFLTDLHN